MNRKYLLVIALAVCVLFVGAWSARTVPVQYEYKYEFNASEKKANEMGAQGWELVAAPVSINGSLSNTVTFVFRRVK